VRLGRIGFDNVAGYLQGGMSALSDRPELIGRLERITPATLLEQLAGPQPPIVLDVRAASEWRETRIAGSLNIPLGQLSGRLEELPSSARLVVHCSSGYRSSIASSILRRDGRDQVADLIGPTAAMQPVAPVLPAV
jgi:rhodanese-related sulfurtransferase